MKIVSFIILNLFLLIKQVYPQLFTSPCPKLFKYEQRTENDMWYGTVTLISDSELSGVWLRLIFDKPSIQLGNWFGEVVTTDNKEYLVKNPRHKLLANTPYNVRFYIKYNPNEAPPQLIVFRLNARTVCPENAATTAAPPNSGQLLTSSILSTTGNPMPVQSGVISAGSFVRPDGGFSAAVGRPIPTEDDDYFQGDFSFTHNKPQFGLGSNNLDVACGTVIKQPRPLITHGQSTSEAEFPWHAALYHSKGIDLTYICGGSLISKAHVITVAHCVTKRKSQSLLNPENLVVYLGKFYLKRWSTPGIQDRHVERILVHPHYNSQNYSNDIAVLKISEPIEITNYVRPVCLWDDKLSIQSVIGKAGVVVGWGFDHNGRVTEELTKASMPVVSADTCIYSFPDFYSRFTSTKTYCAGFRNGTSVCNGDSGGGMVFPKTTSNANNPIWQLRGLVSISVALQNQLRCDSSHFVVFTDVAKYLDWVKGCLN